MRSAMSLPIVFQFVLIVAACSCCAQPPMRPAEGNQPLWLEREGKRVFLLGANYPWYNGFRGLDLGRLQGTKTIAAVAFWNNRDLQSPPQSISPGTTGFDAAGIEAQFGDMHAIGIHALRWFFAGDGRAFLELDRHGNCTGIDPESLRNIDTVLALTKKHRIFLAPCLLDFRFVTGDAHVRYADGTSGESHADIIRSPQKRKLLIDRFVKPLVSRYADSDAILYWEIMNEAANGVSGVDAATGFRLKGGDHYPQGCQVAPAEMQSFLNEVYDAIKSVDGKHPVMPSGLASPFQLPLVVGRVKADLFGAHYKDDGVSDYGRVQPVATIKEDLFRKYHLVLDKPLIMTEGTAAMRTHLDYYATSAFEGGWAGYFPWTYYRLIGLNDLIRYPRIVTSKTKGDAAAANIEFYRKFNREHAAELSLP